MGEDPLTASLVGSREIGFTIVSMTLSLAAVFIPVLFMGGVLGRLFREFSVTICVAILISGVVSVTLTPMLCSRFLKKPTSARRRAGSTARPSAFFDGCCTATTARCRSCCATGRSPWRRSSPCWRSRRYLFVLVPKGFIPDQDTDQIAVVTEAAQGTAFDKLVEYQNQVADIIRHDPNVEGLVSTIGGSAAATLGGPNLGQIVVHLKPRSDRQELATRHHRTAAAGDRHGARHRGLHAESADRPDRRPGEQEPVSVLDAVARSRAAVRRRRGKLQKGARGRARAGGSDQRPRGHESAGRRRHRPRQGGRPRRHRQPDRERVLRRLRPALGVDHLRAGQRVQGAAGAGAAIPGRSRRALVAAVFQVGHRRQRAGRSARHAGAHAPDDRAADGQSLRPAARRHHLVRPRARRVARLDV